MFNSTGPLFGQSSGGLFSIPRDHQATRTQQHPVSTGGLFAAPVLTKQIVDPKSNIKKEVSPPPKEPQHFRCSVCEEVHSYTEDTEEHLELECGHTFCATCQDEQTYLRDGTECILCKSDKLPSFTEEPRTQRHKEGNNKCTGKKIGKKYKDMQGKNTLKGVKFCSQCEATFNP